MTAQQQMREWRERLQPAMKYLHEKVEETDDAGLNALTAILDVSLQMGTQLVTPSPAQQPSEEEMRSAWADAARAFGKYCEEARIVLTWQAWEATVAALLAYRAALFRPSQEGKTRFTIGSSGRPLEHVDDLKDSEIARELSRPAKIGEVSLAGIPWQPSRANATKEHVVCDELVVGLIERFFEDGPTYAHCCGQRLGAYTSHEAAKSAVLTALKSPVVTVMQSAPASGELTKKIGEVDSFSADPSGKMYLPDDFRTRIKLFLDPKIRDFIGHRNATVVVAALDFAANAPSPASGETLERAKRLYEASTDNDPLVHTNRFPLWSELTEETRQRWIAAALTQGRGEGWRMVPIEPTNEMLNAAFGCDPTPAADYQRYKLMIAAAPSPPAIEQKDLR